LSWIIFFLIISLHIVDKDFTVVFRGAVISILNSRAYFYGYESPEGKLFGVYGTIGTGMLMYSSTSMPSSEGEIIDIPYNNIESIEMDKAGVVRINLVKGKPVVLNFKDELNAHFFYRFALKAISKFRESIPSQRKYLMAYIEARNKSVMLGLATLLLSYAVLSFIVRVEGWILLILSGLLSFIVARIYFSYLLDKLSE